MSAAVPNLALVTDLENVLLDAATGTGAGTPYAVPGSPQGGRYQTFAWQTVVDGTFSALTVVLEGSLDGTHWATMDTSTAVGGDLGYIGFFPVNFVRANVTVFTGGTSVTVLLEVGGN